MIDKLNNAKMKRTLLTFLFAVTLTLAFTSCGSSSLVNKAKKLEIGMTKQEVVNIMGNDYITIAARQTPEGALETVKYGTYYLYIISFMDGKLVEWVYEEFIPNQQQQPQHHRNGNPNP